MIELSHVRAGYRTPAGFVAAVDDVSLRIEDDEILGLAGESGCGKSTLVKVVYGQFGGPLELVSGSVEARFRDPATGRLVVREGGRLRELWWDYMSYVPQGSMSVLNPVMRVGAQILDAVPPRHRGRGRRALRAEIAAFLVELDQPASVLDAYPHQLSGGMRQRVLVALAAFLHPRLIVADEPTTALDVVVQKRILLLMATLQRRQRNALLIVSHDLGVHYQIADRIAIAYAGKLVEIGPTGAVFAAPKHPYTRALVDSLPRIGDRSPRTGIEGRPPSLVSPPEGCRFAARCPQAMDVCRRIAPELVAREGGRQVACHLA